MKQSFITIYVHIHAHIASKYFLESKVVSFMSESILARSLIRVLRQTVGKAFELFNNARCICGSIRVKNPMPVSLMDVNGRSPDLMALRGMYAGTQVSNHIFVRKKDVMRVLQIGEVSLSISSEHIQEACHFAVCGMSVHVGFIENST
jgi:hypothetical protein